MTNTRKTLKGLLAVLLSLCMTAVLCVCAFAAAAETMTETVVVTQLIAANTTPSRTSYTYTLTPKKAENPMPEGTKDGVYTIGPINGATTDANAPTFTLEIDKSKPGVYEYILEKVEATPAGDTFSPDGHIFGYKVEVDEKTGELVVIPYICQSGQPIFSDPDENGYPTKLTLPNEITGKANTTTRTVTTTRAATTVRGTTKAVTGTSTRARWVNTDDETNLILWVIILGIAAVALFLLIFLRRRKDDEEE